MTGAAARKRHDIERREKLKLKHEHMWRDGEGKWHLKAGFSRRGATRAVDRIYELTLAQYLKYECRVCQQWHIRPHSTKWRASLLVQLLEEGEVQ